MRRIGALLGSVILVSVFAFAQRAEAPATGFSLVGLWSGMYHEDELELNLPLDRRPAITRVSQSTRPPGITLTPGTLISFR